MSAQINPRWSVVIPLYNKRDFIESTLESVLAQVVEGGVEVLVIDDGSSDDGARVVEGIGDARVRLIRQPNAGVSAARNHGIRAAIGDWVVFLDADDLLHPRALWAYFETARNFPNAMVLGGGYVRVPSRDVASFEFVPYTDDVRYRLIDDLPGEIIRAGMVFSASSIAINRKLFGDFEVWFPEGESIGEDLDFWLRIAERTPIVHCSRCIALYRVALPSSLTAIRIFDRLFPYLVRLEQRALRAEMPARLVGPSLTLVADARVSIARESIRRRRRREVPGLLLRAWRRMASVRWWFTWVSCAFPVILRWRER